MQPLYALALVIVLGVAAQWIAWRARLPSILLLLLGGILKVHDDQILALASQGRERSEQPVGVVQQIADQQHDPAPLQLLRRPMQGGRQVGAPRE